MVLLQCNTINYLLGLLAVLENMKAVLPRYVTLNYLLRFVAILEDIKTVGLQ